jgi:hypothetical protein
MSQYSTCNAHVGYMLFTFVYPYTDNMVSVAVGLPWLAAVVFNASFNALTEGSCVMVLVSRAPGAPTV